jgi:hypothetical protein
MVRPLGRFALPSIGVDRSHSLAANGHSDRGHASPPLPPMPVDHQRAARAGACRRSPCSSSAPDRRMRHRHRLAVHAGLLPQAPRHTGFRVRELDPFGPTAASTARMSRRDWHSKYWIKAIHVARARSIHRWKAVTILIGGRVFVARCGRRLFENRAKAVDQMLERRVRVKLRRISSLLRVRIHLPPPNVADSV